MTWDCCSTGWELPSAQVITALNRWWACSESKARCALLSLSTIRRKKSTRWLQGLNGLRRCFNVVVRKVKNIHLIITHKSKFLFTFATSKLKTMKSSELVRIAQEYGWQLSRHDSTSHREYEKDGRKIIIPFHGAKEVPTGTCRRILKLIRKA